MCVLKRKIVVGVFLLMMNICIIGIHSNCDAKISNKAMKFLKGTWLSVGQSQAEKFVFTRNYVKHYTLWNKKYTKVSSYKKKGKDCGKVKIIYAKKKGKNWIIKLESGNHYIGHGDGLLCRWKEAGKWQVSYTSSLNRVSKKVY